jgi:hypothetical protein
MGVPDVMDAWYGLALHLVAEAEAASDPVNFGILAQYGLLGFVAAGAIVFGRVSYKREIDRSDRLESEVTRLNTVIIERDNMIIDRVIPALTSAVQVVEEATRLLRDMQHAQEINLIRSDTARQQRPGGDGR